MAKLDKADLTFNLIGRMVMSWNETEIYWFLIYTCLLHQTPRPIAEAIFKRATTGNAQRELIMTVATIALAAFPDILEYLEKARIETNNLALERNDIIHGGYRFKAPVPFESPPVDFTIHLAPGDDRTKRKNIFFGKDLIDELPQLIADIDRLTGQLHEGQHNLIWRYLPAEKREKPLPSAADTLSLGMLLGSPELEPPRRPLIWRPIRPVARTQT